MVLQDFKTHTGVLYPFVPAYAVLVAIVIGKMPSNISGISFSCVGCRSAGLHWIKNSRAAKPAKRNRGKQAFRGFG